MTCVATSLKANCKGNDLLSSVLFALVTFCLFVLLLRLRYGSAEYCDERVCLSVCAFVYPRSCLRNYTSDLHQIPCACYLRLWLGPPLAASRYVMYFSFMDDVKFTHNGLYAGEPV